MAAQRQTLAQLLSFRGRRAMITGAAAGIGEAIAYRFAEAGAALELVDLDKRRLAIVAGQLSRYGVEVRSHVVDLSSKAAIDELWASLGAHLPDILVNNAGVYPFRGFLKVDAAFYDWVMQTNLGSVYWMCQQMIRRRLKRGGVIVNVGSIEAAMPFKADLAHYSVSKAGVIALTRALAKEHGKHGFRVNAVVPGGIVTQGTRSAAKELLRLRFGLIRTAVDFRRRLPIGRFGRPDEVARVVLVLASDLASYVHGAAVPVDGGFLSA